MKDTSKIKKENPYIECVTNNRKKKFILQELPEEFINWQINERIQLFDFLKNKKQPIFFNPHLPTLITLNTNKIEFPINAACKGIGLVPTNIELGKLTKKINEILNNVTKTDFDSSIHKRIEGAMLLYGYPKKIDRFCLGGLEIFSSQSYKNILKNSTVSLFYVGTRPDYKSYQINCIAEIIKKNDSFYKFMMSMRSLFEEAGFHYQQTSYPYAIKYHVVEVFDKSLKVRSK